MDLKRWYDELKKGDHAAHIFHSDAEQSKVIIDLLAWVEEDEKLVVMSDRWDVPRMNPRSRLLEAAVDDGHLDTMPARKALFSSGHFRADALMDVIQLELSKCSDEGRAGLTFVWDLDWLSREPAQFEEHIMQQSRQALTPMPNELTLMGQYGVANFTPQQVERVVRVSQLVLEDGRLNRNFWVVSTNSMGGPPRDRRNLSARSSTESSKTMSS